jgi:hypothetical protein
LLYTVPGQVFYNATRKLVLKGADAVVFVADSGLGKMDENRESLQNLEENLRELGLSLETIPWVLQYNKRDLPQLYSLDELERALNPRGVPSFEAAAASGQGVYETLHAVSRLLFQRLVNELRPSGARATPATTPAPASPTPAPSRPLGRAPVARAQAPEPAGLRSQPGPQAYFPESAGSTLVAPQVTAAPALEPELQGMEQNPFFGTPLAAPSGPKLESTATEPADADYTSYGHIVDLSVEPQPEAVQPNPTGFIKDPLRRAEKSAPARAATPVRTQHVIVTLSRAELRQGGTIRVVLDLQVES